MCLGIPARVMNITGDLATVELGGIERDVSVMLLDAVKEGEWVIIHAGFAIQKIGEKEAMETIALLKEIADGYEVPG